MGASILCPFFFVLFSAILYFVFAPVREHAEINAGGNYES